MAKNNWSREEHILAYNLYCKIPFTKINATYAPVRELAKILGRSDGAMAMKLANFARLDPALKARNVSGLSQGAKGEEEIWKEFDGNWDILAYESEKILASCQNKPLETSANIYTADLPPEGKEREALVKIRINQAFFRSSVLASYDYKCCITGLALPELLVAGHIIPWSVEVKHRINPANGLCLNALHDRAFDKGLITVTPDYRINISGKIRQSLKQSEIDSFFAPYEKKDIRLPQKFHPAPEFLLYHNKQIFKP